MKISKTVLRETAHIAIGVFIADVLMCIVFAALKRFDYKVVLGALWGTVFAVGNFFLLGITVQKALKKDEQQKKFVQMSYTWRMLLSVLGLALGILLPFFNTIAAIVPFLMPQPVILVMRALGIYNPDEDVKPDKPSTDEPWLKEDLMKEGENDL